LLLLLYCIWGAQLITGLFHLGSPFSCWFNVIRVSYIFWSLFNFLHREAAGPGYCGSGIVIAEEADGIRDEGSGIAQLLL
jgi:hypothetical protein